MSLPFSFRSVCKLEVVTMKVIAVANRKGGCGKTTTAINLSACLAKKSFRVLLLDLDPQGHASLGLNAYQQDARDMYHVITRQAKLEEIIITDVFPGLDVAPATLTLAAVEHLPFEHGGREALLEQPLASVRSRYDYVVVDCPPSLGLLSKNARFRFECCRPWSTRARGCAGTSCAKCGNASPTMCRPARCCTPCVCGNR